MHFFAESSAQWPHTHTKGAATNTLAVCSGRKKDDLFRKWHATATSKHALSHTHHAVQQHAALEEHALHLAQPGL